MLALDKKTVVLQMEANRIFYSNLESLFGEWTPEDLVFEDRLERCSTFPFLLMSCENVSAYLIFVLKQKSRGSWKPWLDLIKGALAPPPGKKIQEILVPTMDTARYSYLMDLFIKFKK